MQYFGTQLLGADASRILYIFCGATDLTIQGVTVEGSVLAPDADITFNNGSINGTLVGSSLTGNGQSHVRLFGGCLP
jgi:choice-of-anchor A domain-containing protein